MSGREDVGHFVQILKRIPRSELGLILLAALASMVAAYALFMFALHLLMASGEVDADIPPAQAREELAKRLYGVALDPDAKILDAHDKHGGLRGGGFQWFLVRLAKGQGPGFEADLLAAARAKLEPRQVVSVNAESIGDYITHPLNRPPPQSKLPRRTRAWTFRNAYGTRGDRSETYALFADDKFYLYWQY